MNSLALRKKFLDFFAEKGHVVVPSSSLVPSDPSTLFISAGMQQFISYLTGEKDILKDFENRHLCSIQKCFRAKDIEEVGDDTHHTFFEMLGNWSVGENENGYFKEGAIDLALEFLIKTLNLKKDKFNITIFEGDKEIKKDEESFDIWKKRGIPEERIYQFAAADNFWGPVSETGPCGPCSEIHYDRGEEYGCREKCGPNCPKCQRFVEIWNLVFMEYNKKEDGSFEKLPQRNVDTGIGFERLLAVSEDKKSAYETDLFSSLIQEIKNYRGASLENFKAERIIADHVRGAVFLISDGILPSNLERGYVLRRILRRAIRYGKLLGLADQFFVSLSGKVIEAYKDIYPEVKVDETKILTVIRNEEEKFEKSLEQGLKEADKMIVSGKELTGAAAFYFYQTYGFPLEMTEEIAFEKGRKIENPEEFWTLFKKHQELSRTASAGMFKSGLADNQEQTIKHHTAAHLLLAALKQVLGPDVCQKGSNINAQRLRFDFNHPRKMTEEEIKKVEDIVNQKIKEDLPVICRETTLKNAKEMGAAGVFGEKYGEKVKVYSVGDPSAKNGQVFSKEICGGPHVKRTSELKEFKILKEESSSAGIRRIKGVLK